MLYFETTRKSWISSVLEMVQDRVIPLDTAVKKAKEKYNIDEGEFRKMLDSFQKNIFYVGYAISNRGQVRT